MNHTTQAPRNPRAKPPTVRSPWRHAGRHSLSLLRSVRVGAAAGMLSLGLSSLHSAAQAQTNAHSAAPQPAASAASVERLLSLNGAQNDLQSAVADIENQVRLQVSTTLVQQNGGMALSAQQRNAIEAIVPGVGTVLRQELGWARLKPAYIQLYQRHLNQTQVNRLIELHQDPDYVTIMNTMQQVNMQSAQLIAQRMPTIMHRIEPVLEEGLQRALQP